jgi:hypothetical protein
MMAPDDRPNTAHSKRVHAGAEDLAKAGADYVGASTRWTDRRRHAAYAILHALRASQSRIKLRMRNI